MKNSWRFSFVCAIAMVWALGTWGCDPVWYHRTVVVQSGAVDSSEALHLSGATVTLLCPEGGLSSHAWSAHKSAGVLGRTDESGEFFYVDFGFGFSRECRVRIEKEGYQTREFSADEYCFFYSTRRQLCQFGALYAELTPVTD
jgi:hypothetical protein